MRDKTDVYEVTWTPEKMARALELITPYLEQYPSRKHIMQSYEAQGEALELLSDIADAVKPQYYTITQP